MCISCTKSDPTPSFHEHLLTILRTQADRRVVATTTTFSSNQQVVTLPSDGQGRALLTAHLLLQQGRRPAAWNSPPARIRNTNSHDNFCRQLKI